MEATGDAVVPAYYPMVAGAVGVVSTVYLHETAGRPLSGSRAVETPGQARRLIARSRTAAGRHARDLWLRLHGRGRHPDDG